MKIFLKNRWIEVDFKLQAVQFVYKTNIYNISEIRFYVIILIEECNDQLGMYDVSKGSINNL